MTVDVLTMGRIGVDLYPLQVGRSLRDVESFGKFLGGSATNVAVAAARLGRRSAVITRTGADPFGEFLHDALRSFGVDDAFVTPVPGMPTPVTFCEIFPPDHFPLHFYREPKAPDLEIRAEELDLDAIRAARVFWVTVTGLSQEPSRTATLRALEARARGDHGARPRLPADVLALAKGGGADGARGAAARDRRGRQPRGVRDGGRHARAPRRRDGAARPGLDLAVVKQGPRGVLADDGTRAVEVPPVPVEVVNGLGAGDAFGGALCHGLLAARPVEDVMRFANAAGAIVASRLACAGAMPEETEVRAKLREPIHA